MKGDRYICQRCGNCCRGPGFVVVGAAEIARLAEALGLSEARFIAEYTQLLPNRAGLSLKSKPNHECIFLRGLNECIVHAAKPDQCAGFPNRWRYPGWRESCQAIDREAAANVNAAAAAATEAPMPKVAQG